MRIGIDIDGVLTDIVKFMVDYGTKYCVENNLTYRVRLNQYDFDKFMGISRTHDEKFWNQYLKYYAVNYKPRDLAVEVINKLKEEGNEIYIVTARNEWGLVGKDYGKMKEIVDAWMKENNIYYDKIIYTEGSKLPYCIGNYIDVMIEDSPKNVREIAKKIPVLCFDCSYNQNVRGKNIRRVYSWYDVYNKLKK